MTDNSATMILLVGSDAALLEGLSQTLAARGVSNADITRHVNDGSKAIWFVLAFWLVVVGWLYLDARRPPAHRAGASRERCRRS